MTARGTGPGPSATRRRCRLGPRGGPSRVRERGQATVELALVLPLVVALVLLVLQVGLVSRDQVLVVHAAREAARVAAVDADAAAPSAAARAATPLDGSRLRVTVGPRGGPGSIVRVEVSYRCPTDVPLVGGLTGDVDLRASAAMRVER